MGQNKVWKWEERIARISILWDLQPIWKPTKQSVVTMTFPDLCWLNLSLIFYSNCKWSRGKHICANKLGLVWHMLNKADVYSFPNGLGLGMIRPISRWAGLAYYHQCDPNLRAALAIPTLLITGFGFGFKENLLMWSTHLDRHQRRDP